MVEAAPPSLYSFPSLLVFLKGRPCVEAYTPEAAWVWIRSHVVTARRLLTHGHQKWHCVLWAKIVGQMWHCVVWAI